VSFIGYLRPLVQGTSQGPPPRFRESLLLLATGFGTSALIVYGTTFWVGRVILGNGQPTQWIWFGAAAALAACCLLDAGAFGLRVPMWHRQTPRHIFFRYGPAKAALFWGLDSGLVFTTFRVTSLSWAALALTLLGLTPWWSGLAYGLGFVVPFVILTLLVPRPRSGDTLSPDPVWLMERITAMQPAVRRTAGVLLAASAVASLGLAIVRS
jgi:hypothetical protein